MKKRKLFSRISLKWKLVYGFMFTFCFIITLFGALILHTNGNRYQQQSYEYCRKIVEANISLIDHYFEQLCNVSKIVASDSDIIHAVSYREHNKQIEYSVELYNQWRVKDKIHHFDILHGVDNAVIVGSNGKYLYYSDESPIPDYSFLDQPWFQDAIPTKSPAFISRHPTDYLLNPSKPETWSLIVPVFISNGYFIDKPAYLLCDFSLDPVMNQTGTSREVQVAIYTDNDAVYFPSSTEMSAEQTEQLNDNLNKGNSAFIIKGKRPDEHSYLVAAEQSKISGWSILGILPLDSLESLTRTNTIFVILLIAVSIAVTLFLSNVIAKSLLTPMNQLIKKFNAIGKGEKNVTFEETESVEIDQIAHTAMEMLRKNEELTARNAEEGKQRAQASLRALQHQINPHFLNNVLQSMKALAVCNDTESVSQMATLLGKLLSYSVYNPYDMVPLKQEFEYVNTYVALQNVRFQNRLIYTEDLSPEAANFQMPKLIIQPIVENACVHGLNISEGGSISVSAGIDEEMLCIAVTNSGKNIEPDKLAHLNKILREGSADDRECSIGLLNVRARLKGCYGDGADLEILSRDGMSTSVIITVPITKENKVC